MLISALSLLLINRISDFFKFALVAENVLMNVLQDVLRLTLSDAELLCTHLSHTLFDLVVQPL